MLQEKRKERERARRIRLKELEKKQQEVDKCFKCDSRPIVIGINTDKVSGTVIPNNAEVSNDLL